KSLMSIALTSADVTGVLPIAKGGTGGASIAAAQTALQVYSKASVDSSIATKADSSALTSGLAGKANLAHTHSAADITSGTLSVARGGTGETSLAALLQ